MNRTSDSGDSDTTFNIYCWLQPFEEIIMNRIQRHIDKNKENDLKQWFEILRIPSVSAQSDHAGDMILAAGWFESFLKDKHGMSTRLITNGGNLLLVYAETPKVPNARTVLLYGHYDVMPSDPDDAWITPPFKPTVQDGKIFCRGANDDNGQLFAHLRKIWTYLDLYDPWPLQIKVILDGEKKICSPSLFNFLESEKDRKLLACDALLVSDTFAAGPNIPTITYGLRGVLSFEVKFTCTSRDLHSAVYGGSVWNPDIAFSKSVATIIDNDGKILIHGFSDDVEPLSQLERDALARSPYDAAEEEKQIGVAASFGEPGYTVPERRGARPSFDVNGKTCGYQGEGGKTVIPGRASAKFSFRTVPNNMDVDKTREKVERFVKTHVLADIKVDLKYLQVTDGMVAPLTGKYVAAASEVLEKVYGIKPCFIRDGGSISTVAKLCRELNADPFLSASVLKTTESILQMKSSISTRFSTESKRTFFYRRRSVKIRD